MCYHINYDKTPHSSAKHNVVLLLFAQNYYYCNNQGKSQFTLAYFFTFSWKFYKNWSKIYEISRQVVLLTENKIGSLDDLNAFRIKLEDEVRTLKGARENLQSKKKSRKYLK